MEIESFRQLLSRVLSNDPSEQCEADNIYQSIVSADPISVISLHLQNISTAADEKGPISSLLFLKSMFSQPSLSLQADALPSIAEALVSIFKTPNLSEYFLSILSDASASVFAFLISAGLSPEALSSLLAIDSFPASAVFDCFTKVFNRIPDIASIFFPRFLSLLQNPPESILPYSVCLLLSFASSQEFDSEVVPLISEALPRLLSIPEPTLHLTLSDIYFSLTKRQPFLVIISQKVISLSHTLLSLQSYSAASRIIAMELLILTAQTIGLSFSPFLQTTLELMISASCEVSDDNISESALNHIFFLSDLFSKQTDFPSICMDYIRMLVSSDEWQQRYTALMMVDTLVGSCPDFVDSYLSELTPTLIKHFTDPHFLCRKASLYSFSQLSLTFEDSLSQFFESNLVQTLMLLIESEEYAPARRFAIISLNCVIQSLNFEVINQLSGDLIPFLIEVSRNQDSEIQVQTIQCLISLIQPNNTTASQLGPLFINWVESILYNCQDSVELKCCAIETLPSIGLLVGEDHFRCHCEELIKLSLELLTPSGNEEEMMSCMSAIRSISQNFADIIGKYLRQILDSLLFILNCPIQRQTFSQKVDLSSLSDKVLENSQNGDVVAYDRPALKVKSSAIQTISLIIEEFDANVADSAIPFLKFSAYTPIQVATHNLIAKFIEISPQSVPYFQEGVIDAMLIPSSNDASISLIKLMTKILDVAKTAGFQVPQEKITDSIKCLLDSSQSRREKYLERLGAAFETSPENIKEDFLEISLGYLAKRLSQCPFQGPQLFRLISMTVNDQNDYLSMLQSLKSSRLTEVGSAFLSFARLSQKSEIPTETEFQISEYSKDFIEHFAEDEDESASFAVCCAVTAIAALILKSKQYEPLTKFFFSHLPIDLPFEDSSLAFEAICQALPVNLDIFGEVDSAVRLLNSLYYSFSSAYFSEALKLRLHDIFDSIPPGSHEYENIQAAFYSLSKAKRSALSFVIA